ncbi:MAG: hypothetical protein N2B05_04195 [Gemmatimonadales bacterium]
MTGEPKPGRSARVAKWSELQDRQPAYALVENVDLVVIRFDDGVSVLYGRCLHRGALGIRVEKGEDIDDALETALAHEGPSLVEIMTDPDLL